MSIAAAELASDVRSGQAHPRDLPGDRDFRGSNTELPQAYESGWLACRYIAERYGQHKLVAPNRSGSIWATVSQFVGWPAGSSGMKVMPWPSSSAAR